MVGTILVDIEEPLKAIRYLKKCLKSERLNDAIYFSLGRAFWMIGEEKKAMDNFTISLALNPFDEDINVRIQYYRKEFEKRKQL